MYQEITTGIRYYTNFYCQYLSNAWANIGPAGYSTILLLILIFGWALLKSGKKI